MWVSPYRTLSACIQLHRGGRIHGVAIKYGRYYCFCLTGNVVSAVQASILCNRKSRETCASLQNWTPRDERNGLRSCIRECSLSPGDESVAHLYLLCTNQKGHISALNQRWAEFHGWGLFISEPHVYFNAWHNLDVFMKYRSLAVFCEARQTE
jgi:hypothetical protein